MFFYNKQRLQRAAEKRVAQGQFRQALDTYTRILAREPNEREILCLAADLKFRLRDEVGALVCLKRAAALYIESGEHQKAVSVYRKVLRQRPDDIETLTLLADSLQRVDQGRQAVVALLTAARAVMAEDAARAVFLLERIRRIDPQDVDAADLLADLYTRQKLVAKAQEAHLTAGRMLFERGDYTRSYLHLYEFSQSQPGNREVELLILQTLVRLRSYEDALAHLNTMSAGEGEQDRELTAQRARILFELERDEECLALLHRLMVTNQGDTGPVFDYVGLALERKRLNLAARLLGLLDVSQYYTYGDRLGKALNAILAEDENHPEALQKLVELRLYTGDVPGVLPLFSRLFQLHLGAGRLEPAYQLLQQWSQYDEENDWVRHEMQRVKRLLAEQADGSGQSIRGRLGDIGLADVIQMLESARKTGTLHVRYADRAGGIGFRNGGMVHAAWQNLVGRPAVGVMFRLSDGDFHFEPILPPDLPRTLEGSNTQIVLDTLRQIDEDTHKAGEGQ